MPAREKPITGSTIRNFVCSPRLGRGGLTSCLHAFTWELEEYCTYDQVQTADAFQFIFHLRVMDSPTSSWERVSPARALHSIRKLVCCVRVFEYLFRVNVRPQLHHCNNLSREQSWCVWREGGDFMLRYSGL